MVLKEDLKKYLELNLIDELKLDELTEEAKFAVLSKLTDVVYIRFINSLAELLTDEDNDMLEKMIEQEDEKGFESFLNQKVPNHQDILIQIIAEEKRNLAEALKI